MALEYEELYDRYHFEECCAESFEVVLGVWEAYGAGSEGGPVDDGRSVARHLSHEPVATALAEVLLAEHPDGDDRIHAFASDLIAQASGAAVSGPLLLRAVNAERRGLVLDAEADLTRAVRQDPAARFARAGLAQYASDRGDAARAARLLVEAGMPADDPEILRLRGLAGGDGPVVGRNEPCPCGSGRKYKQCHQGATAALPIERRSGWLINKVLAFVSSRHRSQIVGLASSAIRRDTDDDEFVERLAGFVGDPFLLELAVLEGGGLESFLDQRGVLLPEDELALGEVWAASRRRLWEVIGVDPGASLTYRDTATGDEVTVTERAGSVGVDVGDYFLAVVVPVGTEQQILSLPLSIDLRYRESVIQLIDRHPSADEWAEWYGWVIAAPVLTTREGEALVVHRARMTPMLAWDEFAAGLDAEFDAEPGGGRWLEHHELDDDDIIIRTFLRRDGDDLVVETNAQERWDRVLVTLRGVDPDLVVVPEAVEDVDGRDDRVDLGALPEGYLEDFMREQEERWLDEEVPALGGVTPRQAADDPTRREDLRALLRSFEDMAAIEGAVGFDPDRLRAALGIER